VARVLSVANQKGGVGKTTTAANLASCLAVAGRRCLLVDMDPQANATSGLGVNREVARGRPHPLLRPSRGSGKTASSPTLDGWISITPASGLAVLAGTPGLQDVERQIASLPDGQHRLTELLDAVKHQYDTVFIDCPPSLGLLTTNAMYASDAVIIPIQCEYFAMEGLARVLELVARVGKARGREVALAGVILTMYDPDHQLCREVAAEVHEYFKDSVFRTVIPRDVALAEAPSHGMSIVEYSPRSRGAHAYVELAREVIASG
jgi:chromosome partitioning protein